MPNDNVVDFQPRNRNADPFAAAIEQSADGKKHAHRRFTWYEQIAADGLEYLVATAHFIAREHYKITFGQLAKYLHVDPKTAERRVRTLIERSHLRVVSGKAGRVPNEYEMVLFNQGTSALVEEEETGTQTPRKPGRQRPRNQGTSAPVTRALASSNQGTHAPPSSSSSQEFPKDSPEDSSEESLCIHSKEINGFDRYIPPPSSNVVRKGTSTTKAKTDSLVIDDDDDGGSPQRSIQEDTITAPASSSRNKIAPSPRCAAPPPPDGEDVRELAARFSIDELMLRQLTELKGIETLAVLKIASAKGNPKGYLINTIKKETERRKEAERFKAERDRDQRELFRLLEADGDEERQKPEHERDPRLKDLRKTIRIRLRVGDDPVRLAEKYRQEKYEIENTLNFPDYPETAF